MVRIAEKSASAEDLKALGPMMMGLQGSQERGLASGSDAAPVSMDALASGKDAAPVAVDALASGNGAASATVDAPEENAMKYKAFWSKFKRPASFDVDKINGVDASPVSEGADMSLLEPKDAVDATPRPIEVPASPLYGSEFFVDNQLGDPTLYPPSPDGALPNLPDLTEVPAKQSENGVTEELAGKDLEVPDTLVDSPVVPKADVRLGDSEKSTIVDDKGPSEPAGVPPEALPSKVQHFAPTHDDVKAALMRKTTLDLVAGSPSAPSTPVPKPVAEVASVMKVAPQEMAAFTSVVMDLAGVPQDVWVPLTRAAAIEAGLVPSDMWKPPSEPASVAPATPGTPMASPASSGADAAAEKEGDAKDGDRALKNAYMRFHRSVNSILVAVRETPCMIMHDHVTPQPFPRCIRIT